MTTIVPETSAAVVHSIESACDRIAPTWPLDRFIAVNPYWGWRQSKIEDAASRLGALGGTALTMPRTWFLEEGARGRIASRHLDAAAALCGDPRLAEAARLLLEGHREPGDGAMSRLALVTDIVDASSAPGPIRGRTWTDLVAHQTGQHCAAHFDVFQASWAPEQTHELFAAWRVDPAVTHGFKWRHGSAWAVEQLGELPEQPSSAIERILNDLGVGELAREAYLTAVLLSVNGWAAWCAYRRWQARLEQGDDDAIVDLLAVRLGWEWLLLNDSTRPGDTLAALAEVWNGAPSLIDAIADEQRLDWVLQTALERTYQDTVIDGVASATPTGPRPEVQAVFCIDVRSEVFRRALEAVDGSTQTRGFAGFFGLPISYTPAGSALTRPQLPGLLAPAINVTDAPPPGSGTAGADRRAPALAERQRWDAFRRQPSSVFSFVETMGLLYGMKLVKESLPHRHHPAKWELDGVDLSKGGDRLRPRLALVDDDPAAAAAIGQRVLLAMGVVEQFAPLVMLCGHGSQTANNPHAAGLDCGACGGQTGEVNARALAGLLNDAVVRRELANLGVAVPDTTWFVAALHTTTTDEVELFDTDLAPESHRERVADLATTLRAAGDGARAERAGALGLGQLVSDPRRLERAVVERANDWSQVRPEWGLADNAAFIVAPRWRTSHLDLEGRTFLHDYDWKLDPDLAVLTLIMTAPMVVTNWINMQYHASTVDNRRYGSGNKVLHNVVGGVIGVFEGNGGDLRIGLPIQSLHDGETLQHRPLRLSVFIEAPQASIDAVIDAHQVVQDLVFNGWLHLLRIDPTTGAVEERTPTTWTPR